MMRLSPGMIEAQLPKEFHLSNELTFRRRVRKESFFYLPPGVPLLVDGEVFIPPIEFPEVP
jgi:hypothetical protein